MKKYLFVIFGITIVAHAYGANPETRDVATSLHYVDTQLSNRQDTIPAKTSNKVVTSPVTPTQKGQIGEREIKTNLGDETNINDTAITTVGTVNNARYNKQDKIMKLNSENVVTYTGTETSYTDGTTVAKGPSVVTSTPIYDDTVNTYANGLVRAETLNDAVATGVSNALTQVAAGFVINDIGNVLPTTAYLPAHINGTMGDCYNPHTPSRNYVAKQQSCSSTLFNSLMPGDWGAVFPYETGITYYTACGGTNSSACGKEVHGTTVCSNVTPSAQNSPVTNSSAIATLNQESESQRNGGATTGNRCYYKLLNPSVAGAPWVYRGTFSDCATKCAHECGWYVPIMAGRRAGLFGASAQE